MLSQFVCEYAVKGKIILCYDLNRTPDLVGRNIFKLHFPNEYILLLFMLNSYLRMNYGPLVSAVRLSLIFTVGIRAVYSQTCLLFIGLLYVVASKVPGITLFLRNTKQFNHLSYISFRKVLLWKYTFLPATVKVLEIFLQTFMSNCF